MPTEHEARQADIAGSARKHGMNDGDIRNEMPAMEQVLSDLSGKTMPRYSKHHRPFDGSYLSGYAINKPSMANAMLQNLSQRVGKSLSPVAPVVYGGDEEAMEHTMAIASGAQAMKEVESFYQRMGLLRQIYRGGDVVEDRYALSSDMYAQYIMEQMGGGGGSDSDSSDDNDIEVEEASGPGHDETEKRIEKFKEWVMTLEPYMRILSKYIDKTIGAPTERIKNTRVDNEDGEELDVVELDVNQLAKMTQDSFTTLASNRHWAALNIEDMTMEQRYDNKTKRYIDVFVVDNSGSMNGDPIFKAATYLYNRLEKVVKGWAMLAVIEFSTNANTYLIPEELAEGKPRWLIDTPKKAKWAMKHIIYRYANMNGGGTDIPAGVKRGIELSLEMEKHYGGHKPNITVITDDDGSIARLDPETIDIPVNGLALSDNYQLQNFCIKTGGTYYNLDEIKLSVSEVSSVVGE